MHERVRIQRLLEDLNSAPICAFPVGRASIEVPKTLGVYVILDPDQSVMYVGRTTKARNGLHQRLRNHMAGKSALVKTLFNGDTSRLRKGYSYQFLEVSDDRERALLEHIATAWHCPTVLGLSASPSDGKAD
ncbi:GIY-YIG nuclease family protein [Massilia sp. MB5]|uniref:GIY-YIG nuclease family protein n=1 Tax=Massilia sp. MB5 TaxID=2919578 RepID=UPI001F0DAF6C|nr:GIY-YIG nuclease family protein [Massilia sp. MB5]UMR29228.1 GIY-YIG nuclease family protein [Massilia sp. MB5]